MASVNYEVLTSASQFGELPELRKKLVVLKGSTGQRGKKPIAIWIGELSAAAWNEFDASDVVLDKVGNIIERKPVGRSLRFIGACAQDPDGHRIWKTFAEAEEFLGRLGQSTINTLLDACNEMNYGSAEDIEAATVSAEGNSDEAPTSS